MHCRVRYLLDFDLKIRSGQVWSESCIISYSFEHGLRTPREEIVFTARPKIQSQSQIFRYGGSIFCLPHRPNFLDIFDLCLHWVSVVRAFEYSSIFHHHIIGLNFLQSFPNGILNFGSLCAYAEKILSK